MRHNLYEQAIEEFALKGKDIQNVSDLLLRGTGKTTKEMTPGWSDLDFSIVLKKFTQVNRREVRFLVRTFKEKYPFKVSFTVVTESDLKSKHHHHGTKPLYYGAIVKGAMSLLKSNEAYSDSKVVNSPKLLTTDCYAHISYLIHDLRKQHFSRGDSLSDLQGFALHLVRRLKHVIKDSIVCLSGKVIKDIKPQDICTYFPQAHKELLQILNIIKETWGTLSKDKKELEKIIEFMMEQADLVYETVIMEVKI